MDFERPDTETMLAAFAESDFTRDEKSWNEAVEKERGPADIAEPDEEGNYTTPVLERIRASWKEYNEGNLEDEQMQLFLDRTLEALDQMLVMTQGFIDQKLDDPSNPITVDIRTGFYELREAVLRMKSFFDSRDRQAIEDGLLASQAATNRLMDAYSFFQRLYLAQWHILCPACGTENHKINTKCKKCQGPLPGIPELQGQEKAVLAVAATGVLQGDSAALMTTPNYQKVSDALTKWEAQELDDDTLWHTLTEIEGNMKNHKDANLKDKAGLGELTEEQIAVMNALIDNTDNALNNNLDALARMKRYWEDGDVDHLRTGFEALGLATQQIIEAFQASQTIIDAQAKAGS